MSDLFTADLHTLGLMAAELETYLLSEHVTWPLGGRAPQLTLGQMWLIHTRLTCAPEAIRARAVNVHQALAVILARWPANAERKAAAEAHMRLNLWRAYLDDEERASRTHYATDVTHRAVLTLLGQHYPALRATPTFTALPALDARWQARFVPGAFVWPAEVQAAFPAETFWFLYGLPRR